MVEVFLPLPYNNIEQIVEVPDQLKAIPIPPPPNKLIRSVAYNQNDDLLLQSFLKHKENSHLSVDNNLSYSSPLHPVFNPYYGSQSSLKEHMLDQMLERARVIIRSATNQPINHIPNKKAKTVNYTIPRTFATHFFDGSKGVLCKVCYKTINNPQASHWAV